MNIAGGYNHLDTPKGAMCAGVATTRDVLYSTASLEASLGEYYIVEHALELQL
jgi:hypothetical protein